MPTIDIVLPRPHEVQRRFLETRKRFNVAAWGRRTGKTTMAKNLFFEPEVIPKPAAYFAPTYKDMLEVWREVVDTAQPITRRVNASERRIENIAGGVIEFWSLDNPNAGRGRKYARIIIDEGAFVNNLYDIWVMALRPTLADYKGDAYFFSTPKGMNGFWRLWQIANDENETEWQASRYPTMTNPFIADEEIEALRRMLPSRIFAQEIEAQFLDDAGGVFRNVLPCATAVEEQPEEGRQYAIGVDVASQNDFTVAAVFDVEKKEMVYIDRFNRVDYPMLQQRLAGIQKRYNGAVMTVEQNSIGLPVIDALRSAGLHVQSFLTTNATKTDIIQRLASAFEHGEIKIINDSALIGELQAYEGKRTAAGNMTYSAPPGMHDDCVMATAIAWRSISDNWIMW